MTILFELSELQSEIRSLESDSIFLLGEIEKRDSLFVKIIDLILLGEIEKRDSLFVNIIDLIERFYFENGCSLLK